MAEEAPSTHLKAANPIEPSDPQPIAKPKLLIGEGKDEVEFFRALLRKLEIGDLQVEEYAGRTNLRRYLEVLSNRPGFQQLCSLGVTRDADKSAKSAFQSVCDGLRSFGLPVPERPNRPVHGPPKTAVFIFPGRRTKGMLEDLCLAAVAEDKAMPCVDEYFRCASRKAHRKPKNPAKARVQAWLASQPNSDLQLGIAAQQGIWNWENPAFEDLKSFLRSL
jgi:hypothetical protein